MTALLSDVAIIGAGPCGCALAIALDALDIHVTLYEKSKADEYHDYPSGVILKQNGLSVLQALGIYDRIEPLCRKIVGMDTIMDRDGQVTKVDDAANANASLPDHRIWRKDLVKVLRDTLAERYIDVHYEHRFDGIIDDHGPRGVAFYINDNQEHTASLLFGCDGVWSRVRTYLTKYEPQYNGYLSILAHCPSADFDWSKHLKSATISDLPGGIFYEPEAVTEEEPEQKIMITTNVVYPRLPNKSLTQLNSDPIRLKNLFRRAHVKGREPWGPAAAPFLDAVAKETTTVFCWEHMVMRAAFQWHSFVARVIVIGDAIHPLPPTSGQGINQALEDVFAMQVIFRYIKSERQRTFEDWARSEALRKWQKMRLEQLAEVMYYMEENNWARLSADERAGRWESVSKGTPIWLLTPDIEALVKERVLNEWR